MTGPRVERINWTVIIQGLFALTATIALAYMQMRTEEAIRLQVRQTEKTAIEVKETLAKSTSISQESMDKIVDVTAATHTLVNSAMGTQLQLTSDLSEWKAEKEPTAVNIEAARLAKEKLDAHNKQQQKADEDAKKASGGSLSLFESAIVKSAFIRGLIEGQKENP